jgi:tetrahydromethanopterin S-methyltransferase subunit C
MELDRVSAKRLTACLSYGTVSVSMTLFNKAVFSVYQFNFPNFVTTLQIIISILYMLVLENVRVLEIEPISMKTAIMVRCSSTCADHCDLPTALLRDGSK